MVEGGCLPRFSFEMSFKFSLKVPMAILRHVFVYLALEKKSSSFSFFFSFLFSKAEKQECTYYFMAEVNFNLYL